MSFNRYARRADKTTTAIVNGLRAYGFTVEHIARPVDLAVTHRKWGANVWKFLECKTPKGKAGVVKLRADQPKQNEFCSLHGVPHVTDVFEALLALGERIEL